MNQGSMIAAKVFLAVTFFLIRQARAASLLMADPSVAPVARDRSFQLGASLSPDGHIITANSSYLIRDGQPWFPVMGEFHYARFAPSQWRTELLKMKAGGIDIVSTYVFWIHHEEIQGQWDWSGRRDLRAFVTLAGQLG